MLRRAMKSIRHHQVNQVGRIPRGSQWGKYKAAHGGPGEHIEDEPSRRVNDGAGEHIGDKPPRGANGMARWLAPGLTCPAPPPPSRRLLAGAGSRAGRAGVRALSVRRRPGPSPSKAGSAAGSVGPRGGRARA